MPQLLVRNLPETLVKTLKQRAVEHGVSAEEEHRRILHEALKPPAAEGAKKRTLFDAFRELGQIAPDFDFTPKRTRWKSRRVEL